MVKKTKETVKRDKAGRFKKGTPGGPGRKKGEPRDIICKDGKKRSVETLIDDLLAAYEGLGGDKFLKSWAAQSNRNLAAFVQLLFKFAPQSQGVNPSGSPSFLISEKFMPIVKVNRVITDIRPDENTIMEIPESGSARKKRILELQAALKEKDEELRKLKVLVDTQDVKALEHVPIRPDELPEHSKAEKQSKDSTFITTGDFNREGKLRPDYLEHRERKKGE